jgi:two-component system, OmpR family, phosphate regulon sensor histidine kinase PhoR
MLPKQTTSGRPSSRLRRRRTEAARRRVAGKASLEAAVSGLSRQLDVSELHRRQTDQVLMHMPSGLLAVDAGGRVLIVNAAANRLLRPAGPLKIGCSLLDLDEPAGLVALVQETLEVGMVTEAEFPLEDGPVRRQLQLQGRPLPTGDGPSGALVTIADVTRVRQLENARRDFTANVSHELKTPLSAIQAYSETLLLGALDDADARQLFVQRIADQAGRLERLIQDLLQLARLQSNVGPLPLETIRLAGVIQQSIDAYQAIAQARGVVVMRGRFEPRLEALAEREAVRSICENLIGNAVRYTPAGGRVVVSLILSGRQPCLRVEDSGVGIPLAEQQRVFERFYRVDKARSAEAGGTGLGLAIVKHLVQSLGASVRLRSRVGKGSVFEVVFQSGDTPNVSSS